MTNPITDHELGSRENPLPYEPYIRYRSDGWSPDTRKFHKAPDEKTIRRAAIKDLITIFARLWPGSEFGPAHIALSDYNLLDNNLEFCSRLIASLLDGTATPEQVDTYRDRSETEWRATFCLLEILKAIPEVERDMHGGLDGDDD